MSKSISLVFIMNFQIHLYHFEEKNTTWTKTVTQNKDMHRLFKIILKKIRWFPQKHES